MVVGRLHHALYIIGKKILKKIGFIVPNATICSGAIGLVSAQSDHVPFTDATSQTQGHKC